MSHNVTQRRPWRRRMTARDRDEPHRVSTPLELLFDLTFVIAVATAAGQLHHGLAAGHVGHAVIGYAIVFFGVWWAWMNFTWFASAYDTDDVPYRLLTLVQMGGVLVFATGIPAIFGELNFTVGVVGYVIMRAAMVGQWLRAAAEDPQGRPAALRYAAGIIIVQLGWLAFLWVPASLWAPSCLVLLIMAELAVPAWAESSGRATTWHPDHINERYSLFTIIVLGEVLLAATTAVQSELKSSGLSPALLAVVVGDLVLIFALWWSYFKHSAAEQIQSSLPRALAWGYGHYAIFAAIAALGAGLKVVVDTLERNAHVSPMFAAFCVAIPVAVFLVVFGLLNAHAGENPTTARLLVSVAAVFVLLTALATPAVTLAGSVLIMAFLVSLLVAIHLALAARHPAAD